MTGHMDRFTRDALRAQWASPDSILWGSFDGSGDPMRLTFRQYFDKFVYDFAESRGGKHARRFLGLDDSGAGWKGRLVNLGPGDTEGVSGLCLDPHDLAIAKYVADSLWPVGTRRARIAPRSQSAVSAAAASLSASRSSRWSTRWVRWSCRPGTRARTAQP